MSLPQNSCDRELPEGDLQQEALLSFVREIKVVATKLQQAVATARMRLGGRENWELLHLLEHACKTLDTMSSAMLDFTEEEHLESAGLEQDEEVGLPLDPGTEEWAECFLSLSERINSLAADITTSVARVREINEDNVEIFCIVDSAASIIQNVCSVIDLEVGKKIMEVAFADEETSLEELIHEEDGLDLPASKSTSSKGMKRGNDTVSADEPQQKSGKVEEHVADNSEGVEPMAPKLPESKLELPMTRISSVDAPSSCSNSLSDVSIPSRSSSSQNGSYEGSDLIDAPTYSSDTLSYVSIPLSSSYGSFEGSDLIDAQSSASDTLSSAPSAWILSSVSSESNGPSVSVSSISSPSSSTTQQNVIITKRQTVTSTVQGHRISFVSNRPTEVRMTGNRLIITDRNQPTLSRTTESPFHFHIGSDYVRVQMDGMSLTLTPREGTDMENIIVILSNGMRQLEIVIPE